jgi:hypothetical protein
MNKAELNEKLLQFINEPDLFVCEVYFILNKEDEKVIKLADIDAEDQKELKTKFLTTLGENITGNEELRLVEISKIEERKNILFHYDYDELPQNFEPFSTLQTEHQFDNFSFTEDKFSEIAGIVFLMALNDLTLISYKQHYPINLYKRGSRGMGLWKSNQRLVQIPDDILTIYPDFDFFFLNEELFIKNVKVLERHFSYDKVVAKKAEEGLELIEASKFVMDTSLLLGRMHDMTFARKLAQVTQHSKVLNLQIQQVIHFVNHYPDLVNKFRFNSERSQFDLSTKQTQNLFLKLLNDDFLVSQLTNQYYDSSSKDLVTA